MKITIEVDCTPEEARRTMGLPDIAGIQEDYLKRLAQAGEGGFRPEMLEMMMKGWAPMGDAGAGMWRALTEAMAATPPRDASR